MNMTEYFVQFWLVEIIMPTAGATLGFIITLLAIAMVFKSKFDNS